MILDDSGQEQLIRNDDSTWWNWPNKQKKLKVYKETNFSEKDCRWIFDVFITSYDHDKMGNNYWNLLSWPARISPPGFGRTRRVWSKYCIGTCLYWTNYILPTRRRGNSYKETTLTPDRDFSDSSDTNDDEGHWNHWNKKKIRREDMSSPKEQTLDLQTRGLGIKGLMKNFQGKILQKVVGESWKFCQGIRHPIQDMFSESSWK